MKRNLTCEKDYANNPLKARQHGNEPSKGAKIDEQLREEEQEAMKKKGSFGSKAQ